MEADLKACLFNLLLYTQKNLRADYIRTLTQKVIDRFPSRVIFITVDKNSTSDTLNLTSSTLQGESEITCDLLEIEVAEKSKDRLPFVILPYIIPDLPIYLLWAENPVVENPLSHQLDSFATRMIFDSEATDNLPRFAKAVLEHKKEAGCDVADLNWARTENWRNLLSSTFYSEERLEMLKRAQNIQITYNAHATQFFCHTKTQAVYLQGWLAAQLEWKLTGVEKDCFLYGPLKVEIFPAEYPDLPPAAVISLEVLTTKGEHFSFARSKEQPTQVAMILSTKEKCEIPSKYIFTKSQSGLSLVNEIGFTGTSEHYLKLLSYLLSLEGKWGC